MCSHECVYVARYLCSVIHRNVRTIFWQPPLVVMYMFIYCYSDVELRTYDPHCPTLGTARRRVESTAMMATNWEKTVTKVMGCLLKLNTTFCWLRLHSFSIKWKHLAGFSTPFSPTQRPFSYIRHSTKGKALFSNLQK